LVFIKKITKPKLFKKKTETEPKPVQTDQFRFGFFGQKPVQTGLARFFRFGSVFFCFFLFGSVFSVSSLKTETEPVVFFKILIGFFSRFGFSGYFFSSFLGLIGFSVFLLTLYVCVSFFNILNMKINLSNY
jgi:hypothetical protein